MLTKVNSSHKLISDNRYIKIRSATPPDLESIVNLENEIWSEDQRCSRENFMTRLLIFSEGFLLAEDQDSNLVGTFFCVKRNFTLNKGGYSWDSESGFGSGLSHTQGANGLFGVSATVHPNAPKGTLRNLFDGWHEVANRNGLKYIFGGSRIPGLINFEGTPDAYLQNILDKSLFDPVLSKYMACNLKVGILLPNYFDDMESHNYGVEVYDVID
ncbi:MAG: hypothetical protein A2Z20_06875 [Bdellovibrionales bacterium RBG_16_40_8]|nr:MAG: hypothetical protein A2Z20_06875 [Bdellovibrionales bacterium RBG_16_40_8]